MTEMEQLIKLLEEKQRGEGNVSAPTRDEWVASVDSLLEKIAKWLQPAVDKGLLAVESEDLEISEEKLGTYHTRGLKITAPAGLHVWVRPIARFTSDPTQDGRLDIWSDSGVLTLTRDENRDGKEWGFRAGTRGAYMFDPMTEQLFAEQLRNLLA